MLIWGVLIIILFPLVVLSVISYFQGLQGIKDWLIPISWYVTLITVATGSWVAVNDYRLKIETEKRLSDDSLVESDVKLLKLFSEIMEIAHSRHVPIVSEKVIEGLFEKNIITASDYDIKFLPSGYILATEKLKTAAICPAYGTASQDAAIAAVYMLGKKHPALLDSAIEGLTGIHDFLNDTVYAKKKKMIKKFLDELNECKKQIRP